MRTITREYNLYPIHELSIDAQDTAYTQWLEGSEYFYSSDNCNTLEQFGKLFDVNIRNWSYDACISNYSFFTSLSGNVEELCGVRLATYIFNNHSCKLFQHKTYWGKGGKKRKSRIFYNTDCVLTGYCADYYILKPIYDFLQHPDKNITYLQLMDKCLDSFFRFCRDDMKYTQSAERFNEESQANQWEYLCNGTIFN